MDQRRHRERRSSPTAVIVRRPWRATHRRKRRRWGAALQTLSFVLLVLLTLTGAVLVALLERLP